MQLCRNEIGLRKEGESARNRVVSNDYAKEKSFGSVFHCEQFTKQGSLDPSRSTHS